jgi:hypothetical protein
MFNAISCRCLVLTGPLIIKTATGLPLSMTTLDEHPSLVRQGRVVNPRAIHLQIFRRGCLLVPEVSKHVLVSRGSGMSTSTYVTWARHLSSNVKDTNTVSRALLKKASVVVDMNKLVRQGNKKSSAQQAGGLGFGPARFA